MCGEGVPPILNEECESYCIMTRRLVFIFLLCFEFLKYVKLVFLLNGILYIVWYGHVLLVLSFFSLESA